MSAHTPGPWHVASESKLCIDAPDGNVAIVNLARASEADARLIAAAPDLLAALKLSALDLHAPDERGECRCSQCDFRRAARAAISKAEGSK